MSTSRWSEVGQEVMDSVLHAVESGDFTGLSKSVGDVINETVESIGRGMDQVGKEIERQAKARGMDTTGAQGVWTGGGSRQPQRDAGWEPGQASPGSRQTQRMQRHAGRTDRRGVRYTGKMMPAGSQFPARYRRFLPGQAAGPALLATGIVGTSMFGIATLLSLIGCFVATPLWGLPIGFGIATVPFIWMITRGAGLNGRNHRFRNYVRAIGDRGYCAIEELARAVGKKKGFVRKDLQDMLRRGYFLEGHLDREETTLIVDHETYEQYTQAEEERVRREQENVRMRREQETARDRQEEPVYTDEVQRILAEGEAYISHIHECNDAIPGEVMSEKLEKLEDIMRRIFAQVKKQPESADDLHKFMTYYLPTTTKLIDAYRDLDGQPEYGTNVANTKKEIEATLDTINEAFINLFDSLFEETAWDISADISTMKVMLQQEGLTGNKDFR